MVENNYCKIYTTFYTVFSHLKNYLNDFLYDYLYMKAFVSIYILNVTKKICISDAYYIFFHKKKT